MNYLTQNKNWDLVEDYNLDKLLYLLIDRPTRVNATYFICENDKKLFNRNYDLPAILWPDCIVWYNNGKIHRVNDKPAKIWENGYKQYWTNDKLINNK